MTAPTSHAEGLQSVIRVYCVHLKILATCFGFASSNAVFGVQTFQVHCRPYHCTMFHHGIPFFLPIPSVFVMNSSPIPVHVGSLFRPFLCKLLISFLLEVCNSALLCFFCFLLIRIHFFATPLKFLLPFFSVFSEMSFYIKF